MAEKFTVKAKSVSGRWRAGIHFTRAGITTELTEAQLKAIKSDPELFVTPAAESEAEREQREAAEKAAAEKAAAEKAAAEKAAAEKAAAEKAAAEKADGKKAGK